MAAPAEIEAFCLSCIMIKGLLAVWALFGRDPKFTKRAGRDQHVEKHYESLLHRLNRDLGRSLVPRTAAEVGRGRYKNGSSGNTMLWAVYEIRVKKPNRRK